MGGLRSLGSTLNRWLSAITASPGALRRWSIANLVCNIGIIVTGAVVRLTDSGLGCSTWPKCTPESYTPHAAVGHHGLIEFGNRTLTFILIIVAVLTLISAYRAHAPRQARMLAWVIGIGIPFQGVIGGITVLAKLNPFVVALHLLLSLALVVLCTKLVLVAREAPIEHEVDDLTRFTTVVIFIALALACWLGTVVTGSGPHSGDRGAVRTGFDIESVSRLHSGAVWVTMGLTVALLTWTIRRGLPVVRRRLVVLLMVGLAQGVIGYIQYFTGLPAFVVALHMLGAGLAVCAGAGVLFSCTRATASEPITAALPQPAQG